WLWTSPNTQSTSQLAIGSPIRSRNASPPGWSPSSASRAVPRSWRSAWSIIAESSLTLFGPRDTVSNRGRPPCARGRYRNSTVGRPAGRPGVPGRRRRGLGSRRDLPRAGRADEDHRHASHLPEPCRGVRCTGAGRAVVLHEAAVHAERAPRPPAPPARRPLPELRGRGGGRDRPADARRARVRGARLRRRLRAGERRRAARLPPRRPRLHAAVEGAGRLLPDRPRTDGRGRLRTDRLPHPDLRERRCRPGRHGGRPDLADLLPAGRPEPPDHPRAGRRRPQRHAGQLAADGAGRHRRRRGVRPGPAREPRRRLGRRPGRPGRAAAGVGADAARGHGDPGGRGGEGRCGGGDEMSQAARESAGIAARTGRQFLDGLRGDARELWLNGVRITHPLDHDELQGAALSLARVYDLQHEHAGEMLAPSPADGRLVNVTHLIPRSREDLERRRRAIEIVASLSGGTMGRTPDYLNVTFACFAGRSDVWARRGNEQGAENLVAYQAEMRDRDLSTTHSIMNPQVDRTKPEAEQ